MPGLSERRIGGEDAERSIVFETSRSCSRIDSCWGIVDAYIIQVSGRSGIGDSFFVIIEERILQDDTSWILGHRGHRYSDRWVGDLGIIDGHTISIGESDSFLQVIVCKDIIEGDRGGSIIDADPIGIMHEIGIRYEEILRRRAHESMLAAFIASDSAHGDILGIDGLDIFQECIIPIEGKGIEDDIALVGDIDIGILTIRLEDHISCSDQCWTVAQKDRRSKIIGAGIDEIDGIRFSD